MKFSLKEAFEILSEQDAPDASDTRSLLDVYGLVEVKHPAVEGDTGGMSEADDDEEEEAVEESVGDLEQAEEEVAATPAVESANPRRDDLTLERWRSMAGLV